MDTDDLKELDEIAQDTHADLQTDNTPTKKASPN